MAVADATRMESEGLREQLARGPRPVRRERADAPREDGPPRIREGVETEALRLVVAGQLGPEDGVVPALFLPGPAREAYESLLRHGRDVAEAVADASPVVADLLTRMATSEPIADPADLRVRLAEAAGERVLRDLERDARQSERPLEYVPITSWVKLRLDDLRGDVPSVDAVDELLAWLAEQAGDRP
jgi:hypothetical protein